MTSFNFSLPAARTSADVRYPTRAFRRSWTYDELVALFPCTASESSTWAQEIMPFRARDQDSLTTVDVDPSAVADLTLDVTASWPFDAEEFDFIYMSHVVEHMYHQDRDALIRRVHKSLNQGGLAFIRVPHWRSMQQTGWEHHTRYGIHGATSLCHGHNPMLPMFRAVSRALARGIGRPLDAGVTAGLALVVTVLGLAIFLPMYGLMGAAVASLLAYLLSTGWMLHKVRRALGVTTRSLILPMQSGSLHSPGRGT